MAVCTDSDYNVCVFGALTSNINFKSQGKIFSFVIYVGVVPHLD